MFSILGYALLGGLAVFVILWLLNKRAGHNILHFARTKAGQVGDIFGTMDPVGQMKQAAQDAMDDIGHADKALIACNKLRSRLKTQVDSDTRQSNLLRQNIADKLKNGVPETDAVIVENARRIADFEKSIAENKVQFNQQAVIYENLLKNANSATVRIQGAQRRAEQKQVQLEVSQGNLAMATMVNKYNPATVAGKLNNIDKYEQVIDDQIEENASTLKVMQDRGMMTTEDDSSLGNTEEVNAVLNSIKQGHGSAKEPVAC